MYSLFDNFLDSDIDDYYNAPLYRRRPSYRPSWGNRRSLRNTTPRRSLVPRLEDTWLGRYNDADTLPDVTDLSLFNRTGNLFTGFNDAVEMKEDSDKYVVCLKDPNIKDKEVKVDFLKRENELILSASQKICEKCHHKITDSDTEQHYTSNYQSSIKFEKPVRHQDIKADIKDDGVAITLPKLESDDKNVVKVQLEGSRGNVQPLLETGPSTKSGKIEEAKEHENEEAEATKANQK